MKVHQIFTNGPLRNFSYIIETEDNLFCVDPYYPDQILKKIQEIKKPLKAIINTHEHTDHHCGNQGVIKATHCAVWAHTNAKGKIPGVDRFLQGDEIIPLDRGNQLIVLDTPGHTFAHVCLLLRGHNSSVVTGDTLFNGGVGNCHNGGDPRVLFKTISSHFQNMNDDIRLYPGHEYMENNLLFTLQYEPENKQAKELLARVRQTEDFLVNTIGDEKKINIFLRSDEDSFLHYRRLRDKW